MGGVWEGQKLVFTRVCVCGLGRRRLNAGSCPRANRKSSITRTKNHLNTSQILEKSTGTTGVNTLLSVWERLSGMWRAV